MGRVLYVLGFLPTYVQRELRELRRRGVDVEVVLPHPYPGARMWDRIAAPEAPDPPDPLRVDFLSWLGLPPARIPSRLARGAVLPLARRPATASRLLAQSVREGTLRYLLAAVEVAHALRGRRIDRIHVHFADHAAEVGYWLSRWLDVPFTLTTHAADLFVPRDPARLRRLLRRATRVLTISESNRRFIEDRLGERLGDRIRVTRLGVDPAALPPRRPAAAPPFRIVSTASGLVEKKGLPCLLEACGELRARSLDFECEILGSDPSQERLSELRQRARAEGLAGVVHLPGALPSREALSRVAAAHAFALPCTVARNGNMDGIPVSLIEAMGIGVPVVSTRVSGIPELVEDGVSGLLVEPDDPKALADALERVLRSPEEAERRAARGRERVERHFSLHGYVDRLEQTWARQ